MLTVRLDARRANIFLCFLMVKETQATPPTPRLRPTTMIIGPTIFIGLMPTLSELRPRRPLPVGLPYAIADSAMPITVTAKPIETKTDAARCCFCRKATCETNRGGSLIDADGCRLSGAALEEGGHEIATADCRREEVLSLGGEGKIWEDEAGKMGR